MEKERQKVNMDLGAYAYIDNLQHILEQNEIYIGRLRGLRLMSKEKKVPLKRIEEEIKFTQVEYAKDWLLNHSEIFFRWSSYEKKHKAFVYKKDKDGDKYVSEIDLTKVHGKDKKRIKFRWKQIRKAYEKQYAMFNGFVGKDVLYVHARQGGFNREGYPIDTKHPMYLCDIDDAFDNTYCDIYYDLKKTKERQ